MDAKATVGPSDFGALAWREVGPARIGSHSDKATPFEDVSRVGFDRAVPYHIMGGLEDHQVWWGPNTLWNGAGLSAGSWRNITAWDDGVYVKPDPTNDDVIYESWQSGDLARLDLRTGDLRDISPRSVTTSSESAEPGAFRFNGSAPLLASHHTPMVLFGANILIRTYDGGNTWSIASPDLTQPCDTTSTTANCTISSLAEETNGTIWAGTDNGHLNRSPDGGSSWHDVIGNVDGLPPQAMVDGIDAGKDAVFVTFDRRRLGDTKPYVYETGDNGATWRNISGNLPRWAYVIRQDPRAPSLLFAGTEDGVWASFDRGGLWIDLRLGTERAPVFDLQIQPDANDLIAATHGRGFAILDDLTALEALADASRTPVSLFDATDAYRYVERPSHDDKSEFVSGNKPYGSVISYYLKPRPAPSGKNKNAATENVELQILDGDRVIRNLHASAIDGINRVPWDLTTDTPGASTAVTGPEVLPGTYTVRLNARGQTLTVPVSVKLDPSVRASRSDLQAQYDALARLALMQERGETWISTHADAAARTSQVVDQIASLRSRIATSFSPPTREQGQLIEWYSKQLDDMGAR